MWLEGRGVSLWPLSPIVFVCVCAFPAGPAVCSPPGVGEGGSLWQANHDQLGSPAHKELRSRMAAAPLSPPFRLHLHVVNLTSYCTDTSIIVIKGAGVIYLYTDFPQDEGRTN